MMRRFAILALALTAWLFHPAATAAATPEAATDAPQQHDARMNWFREARFGMFVHWGLYSLAAGEWNGKPSSGAGEWIMNDLQIPQSQYQKLLPQFNPVQFDARQWVRLAKDAGMKYIVITTKHHDGFAMYPSALTDWSIKSTGFHRDPLKELAAACQAEGIRLCFYHSIMDWRHPDYAPRKPWNDLATGQPEMDRYVQFMKGQLKELLTGYGPIAALWFDGAWENTWTYERGAEIHRYVRSLQPDIIMNNRVATEAPLQAGQSALGDFKTPEQTIPSNGLGPGVDWESCMTMNNTWGFKRSDQDWKSTQTLVRNLVDCASKGGNYLLNVGPTAEGLIPEASVERLRQIGQWTKLNGQALYATTASPFTRPLPWGRCTQRAEAGSTTLYFHVFDWPADGELVVPGLRNPVQAAWLLDARGAKTLVAQTTENGLSISLPKASPGEISSTVGVRFVGPPDIQAAPISQKRDGSVILPASDARLHGSTFRYESGGQLDNIGYWTTPEEWADWEFKITQPGDFTVSAIISAPASGVFNISVAGQTIRCAAPKTGDYFTFTEIKFGKIRIPTNGTMVLAVRPIIDGWQPMNLKGIRLHPVMTN